MLAIMKTFDLRPYTLRKLATRTFTSTTCGYRVGGGIAGVESENDELKRVTLHPTFVGGIGPILRAAPGLLERPSMGRPPRLRTQLILTPELWSAKQLWWDVAWEQYACHTAVSEDRAAAGRPGHE